MQQSRFFNDVRQSAGSAASAGASRKTMIGIILVVALIAFEIFNFDTTRFALNNLLGDVAFFSIAWATILAIAFCAIDFAGLARLFTPEKSLKDEPRAVWFLMGAWLLGATMNAVMTWWAVSVSLLSHEFGNEVLGREALLRYVPIFVAGLVWLTRILFIGAFSVAGEHIFDLAGQNDSAPATQPKQDGKQPPAVAGNEKPGLRRVPDETPRPAITTGSKPGDRTYNRPPLPSGVHQVPSPMQASKRN